MTTEPTPPRPWAIIISLISVAVAVGGIIFGAGKLNQRVLALENWRIQATGRVEIYDARIREVESLHASTQADLASIKASVQRIERAIDTGDPP